MSSLLIVLACIALSLVAAAGVLTPFRRPGAASLAPAVPSTGSARDAEAHAGRAGGRRAVRVGLPAAIAGIALVAVTVPFILGATRSSTGASPAPISAVDGFRQRVAEHPDDIAARLELAFLLLGSGDAAGAANQYVAVLARDPSNAEARTQLAWILLGAGRPREALRQVDRALSTRPGYAEALWVRGVTLLQGLDRPQAARRALRAYLAASPYGAHRAQAAQLLRQAQTSGRRTGG